MSSWLRDRNLYLNGALFGYFLIPLAHAVNIFVHLGVVVMLLIMISGSLCSLVCFSRFTQKTILYKKYEHGMRKYIALILAVAGVISVACGLFIKTNGAVYLSRLGDQDIKLLSAMLVVPGLAFVVGAITAWDKENY